VNRFAVRCKGSGSTINEVRQQDLASQRAFTVELLFSAATSLTSSRGSGWSATRSGRRCRSCRAAALVVGVRAARYGAACPTPGAPSNGAACPTPGAPSNGALRRQRAISQASLKSNSADTRTPRSSPVTRAVPGPP
jgi:hypothetical protein